MVDSKTVGPYSRWRPQRDIADAVKELAKVFGGVAVAKSKFIEACEAGVLQTFWRGRYDSRSPSIERRQWVGADIDMKNGAVVTADGRRMLLVDVDRQDFEVWRKTLQLPVAGARLNPADQPRGGHKTRLAKDAALAIWGPGGVPKEIPPQTVFKMVADHVQQRHRVSISKFIVRRALGLK